jgi:tetratricopeptide (TPR) repeat protein
MAHDWNWEGANASFERALTLEPGNATTMWSAARLAKTLGSFERALELDRKAVELNPLDTTAYLNLGDSAYYLGDYDEAANALKKSLELNPQFPVVRAYLGRVYLMQGRPLEALAVMEQETDAQWRRFGLAIANYGLGRKKEADAALAEFIERDGSGFAYQIAEVYAYRGQADLAFQWLDRAYAQRDGGLTEFRGDPLFKNIEGDPRHTALLRKMNVYGAAGSVLGSSH